MISHSRSERGILAGRKAETKKGKDGVTLSDQVGFAVAQHKGEKAEMLLEAAAPCENDSSFASILSRNFRLVTL